MRLMIRSMIKINKEIERKVHMDVINHGLKSRMRILFINDIQMNFNDIMRHIIIEAARIHEINKRKPLRSRKGGRKRP